MAVDFDLKGKHVIVTGSGRGIGRGMAEGFAAAGCKVVFMDINTENLDEAVKTNREKGYDVYGVCGDLSEVAEVDRMFDEGLEKLDGILDVMVTAAGQKNKMIECIKAGANEFLTKPFEQQEIVDVINKMSN